MAELSAMQQGCEWRLSRRDSPCTDAEALPRARAAGRAVVWRAANALADMSSVWELEYFKACLGEPEIMLGFAETLAADGESQSAGGSAQAGVVRCAPTRYCDLRTVIRAFARRGLAIRGSRWQSFRDRACFVAASAGACVALTLYIIRYSRLRAPPAFHDGLLLAVHAEWSNRTRHVLTQLGADFPADAILLLGRLHRSPDQVAQDWSEKLGIELPPVFVPVSAGSALRALPRMLQLLRHGLRLSARQPYLPGLRDHVALVFRVLLGAIMQQWWKAAGCSGGRIVYGHTGTADTTMLEQAQQGTGARSLHMVHGIATGPNFLGFSDLAVFRCGHDARLYQGLHHYGRCIAPPAPQPRPARGERGILLLTNYAHPLNPGYITGGLADELRVLRDVAAIAGEWGRQAEPLFWKPHPILSALPQPQQDQLLEAAKSLGYALVSPDTTLRDAAARAHWTLVTPSTAALDLLVDGYLSIVLDWQASEPDAATSMFPTRVAGPVELRGMLDRLALESAYNEDFRTAWSRLAPAQAATVAVALRELG